MIGERIKIARKSKRLSLREFGDKIGVSHQTIFKYEKDELYPDSESFLKISQVTGFPMEFFFRQTPLYQIEPAYRKKMSLKGNNLDVIKNQIQDYIERYTEIEEMFPDEKIEFQGEKWQVSAPEDVEEIAIKLRNKWGLGDDPIESLSEILEENGIRVIMVSAEDGFSACIFTYNSIPVIAVNENISPDRQRFSIAHELGHLFLEVGEEMDEEKIAHRFAGAFLVPYHRARKELGKTRTRISLNELTGLKKKYGLSISAWVYRAKDLNIINDSSYTFWNRLIAQKGWKKSEPDMGIKPEYSGRMERLVFKALEEDLISESRAGELLRKSIIEIRKGKNER